MDFINMMLQLAHEVWHWKEDFNTEKGKSSTQKRLHPYDHNVLWITFELILTKSVK